MTHKFLILLFLTLICAAGTAQDMESDTTAAEAEKPAELLLREHEEFEKIFTVTNPYERAVRIEKTDTSCSCIRFELGKKFLLPGESTTLDVKVSNERSSGPRTYKVWLYVSDPEYAPIEIKTSWLVKEDIAVDVIKSKPEQRPDDKRHRDIYRYIAHVKPAEAKRLRKYIRLSTPDELSEGLQVTPAYDGEIWTFETKTLDKHSVLVIATAKNPEQTLKEGLFTETVSIKTNHPHKQEFTLEFNTSVDPNAGNKEQAATDFPMP